MMCLLRLMESSHRGEDICVRCSLSGDTRGIMCARLVWIMCVRLDNASVVTGLYVTV